MRALDFSSLAPLGGLVVVLCGVSFVLNTVLRRDDAVGRLWSVAFSAGILQVLSYLVWDLGPDTWWALAVGNFALVLALGMMWAGCRRANDRDGLVWIPIAAAVLAALAVVVRGPGGGTWAGALEMFIGVMAFAVLSAAETVRGELSRSINSRTMTVVFGALALYYAARSIAFVATGPQHPVFEAYFGAVPTLMVDTCLVVVGTVALSTIQAERFGPGELQLPRGDAGRDGRSVEGAVGPRVFRELAESWLLRSLRERVTLVLVLVELANLDEINAAFGRQAGDRAIRLVGRVVTTEAPTAALIGHLAPHRFAVLMPLPLDEDVTAIVQRIESGVLGASLDDEDRFRASTVHGIATTRASGPRYDDLLGAGTAALAAAATGFGAAS